MVCLSANFPTFSDCSNINPDNIALHCHFIFMDKQICIQKMSSSFNVMVFGFCPPDYRGNNISYCDWYTVEKFNVDEFHLAQKKFLDLVNVLLFECYKPF